MTAYPAPVRNLIREERDRLLLNISQEEARVREHRSKLRPLEIHIKELKAELAVLDDYDPDPTGHSDHREGETG